MLYNEELISKYNTLLSFLEPRQLSVAQVLLGLLQNSEETESLLYQLENRAPHDTMPKDTLLMDSEIDPMVANLA